MHFIEKNALKWHLMKFIKSLNLIEIAKKY